MDAVTDTDCPSAPSCARRRPKLGHTQPSRSRVRTRVTALQPPKVAARPAGQMLRLRPRPDACYCSAVVPPDDSLSDRTGALLIASCFPLAACCLSTSCTCLSPVVLGAAEDVAPSPLRAPAPPTTAAPASSTAIAKPIEKNPASCDGARTCVGAKRTLPPVSSKERGAKSSTMVNLLEAIQPAGHCRVRGIVNAHLCAGFHGVYTLMLEIAANTLGHAADAFRGDAAVPLPSEARPETCKLQPRAGRS